MASPRAWIEPLARSGYFARGLIYLIIGFFTLLAAFGSGEKTDSKGALHKVLAQPFGEILLCILVAGILGYSLWRLLQALLDPDGHGRDLKGLVVRAALLVSAATYFALALYALSLLGLFSGGGGGDKPVAQWLGGLFGRRWTTLGLALIFAGVAVAHWIKAGTRRYARYMEADQRQLAYIHPVAIVGLSARGLIFALLAATQFYRTAANDWDQSQTPNLEDALSFAEDLSAGSLLLAAVALGLVAFALYSFVEARWRRVGLDER